MSKLRRSYSFYHLKFDLIAAVVVFLVAIPLCLGIALASGAPLFSGIISGAIGGIVVGLFSRSPVSVSGPDAGMAAIVITAIYQLGSFDIFLMALFLAGIIQLIFGWVKAGFLADYIPYNVVQGLLCAIGILLIIKQLPLAFTLATDFNELKTHLIEQTESFAVSPLYVLYYHLNFGAIIISLLSLGLLISWPRFNKTWLKLIPAPIIVVATGIALNEYFLAFHPAIAQDKPYLINLPSYNNFGDLLGQLQFPNWHQWNNPKVYLYAFIIAVIASVASLLNVKVGEKLDLKRRVCSKDKELQAQGIGNIVAGLLGGIPVTSVIVRTSVNIQAGSKTKCATIFHGIFLLLAVLMIPRWLNKIPLSSLASVLIYTGYTLNQPTIYSQMWRQGSDRFIPFLATVISIVLFNLLIGILIGLAISFFYILRNNSQARLNIIKEIYPTGEVNRLMLPQQISFLNKASLIAELETIPKDSQLIIDARYCDYIDKEIIELIHEFQQESCQYKRISLNLIGFKPNYDIHNDIDFINVTTYDVQTQLTASQVLTLLQEGNQRFLKENRLHRSLHMDIQHTAKNQHPLAVVLACIDSRVPVETIFDMSFGDLFCIRVAGNVVNQDILASIEYACHVVGAKLIVVLGHTRCGAIQAACDDIQLGNITQLLAKIKPAVAQAELNASSENKISQVTQLNIAQTMTNIYCQSPILQTLIQEKTIALVGGLYDVSTGEVNFSDYSLLLTKFSADSVLIDRVQQITTV